MGQTLTNQAATPGPSATTVNYQGQLANIAGVPLDGIYGMSFALYDAVTGGNLIWGPEAHTAVEVNDGLFSVGLGSRTSGGIPTTTWNGDRYLEITVAGETLEPRELIRSVPIAGMALTVPDGAIGARKLGDAFGSSQQPLLNFVPHTSTASVLDLTEGVDWTAWDLRPIVGDSAVAVVVYARVASDTSGAYLGLRSEGTTQRTIMVSGYHGGQYKGYGEVTVSCDPQQLIEYTLNDGNTMNAQIHIVGWYEPAKITP